MTKKTGRARTAAPKEAKPETPEAVAERETALARSLRDNLGIGPLSARKLAETIHKEMWRLIHEAAAMKEARDKDVSGQVQVTVAIPARDEEGEPQDKGEPAAKAA